eukprot:GILI01012325.1.p1 GENE.GILI01012325.1~~GILI01012325.1.p1  ORF type:complete len:1093 (-),score=202.52 GILI01012325.1:78-3299(-)
MSSKIKFAVDSDYTSDRCTVRMDHSGNITLAPVDQSSYRIRGQNKDPSTTDFKSPDVIETPMPPASVYFLVSGGGTANLGDPLEPAANSGRSSIGPNDDTTKSSLGAMATSEENQNRSQKAILTIFFKGQSGLAAPSVPIAPRITFPSHPLSFEPPKLAPPKAGETQIAVPSAEVHRLVQGPDQDACPYELRARNIEPRIHITASANNSICTFSTNLHDQLLFDQNGSAVGPKYGRAFGVLSSMHLKGLTPTAVCTSAICALVTSSGETMSPPSSPLMRQQGNAGTAYNHKREKSDASAAGAFPATVVQQWSTTPDEVARQHKVLADSLNGIKDMYQHEAKMATDGASRARLSWQTTKRKDEAIIVASKYTATIAFEPILFIGVHTGSIDVVSLSTQKELFRFNTSELKGSKIIEGYSVSAIECVHSMAQSCVSSVLKAAQSLEGRVWVSGGSGSTRNYSAYTATSHHPIAGGANPLNNSGSSSSMICSAETPIRSVYAAGYDNGEVLLLAISKTSGEVLRKVSYGNRPVTSISVGCLPWEMHTPHPHSKHAGRNYHKPNDVNGAGAAASGKDYFQLVWHQRDEFLFEMSGASDVQRLLSVGHSNEVSLTPPRSNLSDTDSIGSGGLSPASGGRYPEDQRNEPYPTGALYSPPTAATANGLPTAKRLTSASFLRRSAFWNNFALVCVAGGSMHLVATSLSDAGERAEVRTVKEVSIRQFKSCGSIVASKLFFTVAPGSMVHSECVRRDPEAQRQQLTFMAVTTQSNTLLVFRLAFGLTDDIRSPLHNISTVDISLIAKRDAHRSWINSLTVLPLPNRAFAFAGEGGFGALIRSPTEQNKSVHVSNSFATPNRGKGQGGPQLGASGDFFGQRSMMLNRSRNFAGGAGSDDGESYDPLVPFMLVALGMDQRLSFWVCEASLLSPQGAPNSSPDSNRMRSRRGTHTSASITGLPSKGNLSTTGPLANTSFGLNSTQGGPSTAARLPIAFSISQEPAMTVTNTNPKEDFEPWTSLSSCGVDGHQTFMCLGLRGKAKFYDCEIEENSGRVSAPPANAGQHGSSAALRSSSTRNRKPSF